MNKTPCATDPLGSVLSEDQAVQSVLDALRMGRLEQAVHETQILFTRQGFGSGGLPIRLSATWEDSELTPAMLERPADTQARTERGHSRFVRGLIKLFRHEPATKDLRGAFDDVAALASLNPHDSKVRVWLANLIIFNARYVADLASEACANLSTAKRELKDALALEPGYGPVHHARGLISLFAAGCIKGNGADPSRLFHRAIDSFQEAARLDSSYACTHQNLGLAKKGLGRWQDSKGTANPRLLTEAISHFEQASHLDPTLWRASYKAAQVYLLLKNEDEARRCLEKCRKIKTMRPSRLGKLEGKLWRSVAGSAD